MADTFLLPSRPPLPPLTARPSLASAAPSFAAAPLATATVGLPHPRRCRRRLRSRRDGVHFVGVATAAAAAAATAAAASVDVDSCSQQWRWRKSLATKQRPSPPRPPRIAPASPVTLRCTDRLLNLRHVRRYRPLRPQRAEDASPRGAYETVQPGVHDGESGAN